MKRLHLTNKKLGIFFLILAIFTSAPIWGVEYFINQDGSGHVHSAWMMLEMLRGNARLAEIYNFNFVFYPNSTGHWLLAFLLLFLSPFTATKIITSLTYLGMPAAIGWLRWKTVGRDGLLTSVLLGAALGFNWLWLEGFYNFKIGLIISIFVVGSYFRWRENMNPARAGLLALGFVTVFFSHLVSFAFLVSVIATMSVFVSFDRLKQNLLWTAAAFVPVAPLIIIYKLTSEVGGQFSPVWRDISDPYSLTQWLTQLRSADSFIIISRRTFPLIDAESGLFVIFTPLLWLLLAYFILTLATWLSKRREDVRQIWTKSYYAFLVLFAGFILAAMFSPDDIQFSNSLGGVLRERFLLFGLIVFVPLFRTGVFEKWLKFVAQAALVAVIVFQTLALWDYALRTNRLAKEFMAAEKMIPAGQSLASVTISDEPQRFSAIPIASLDNYFGINRDLVVWDNYEIGHSLFPIIADKPEDQKFALELTGNNFYDANNPKRYSAERIAKLNSLMASNHQRIDVLLVWGNDARVETAFREWFENEPYFQNGRVRLFRRKQ